MFDIAKDVAVLRKVFADNPNIKIVIIDPLTAYLGASAKAKENTDVRRVLTPLVKLAEEFGVLQLANNHLNKNGGKALYRVLDSIAFVALGRTIHLVAEDTDNRDLKKFICDKSNIGSKPLGLTYIIQKVWITGEEGEQIETSRISWGFKHIDETADEALNPDSASGTATDEAVAFLRTVLANGRVKVQDIEAEARNACLLGQNQSLKQSKPFRSAKDQLHIHSARDGFGPGAIWYWSLPEHAPPDGGIGAHRGPDHSSSKNRAPMEGDGAYGEKSIGALGHDGAYVENAIGALDHHRRPQKGCGANGVTSAIPVEPPATPVTASIRAQGGRRGHRRPSRPTLAHAPA
jgi:hypothetical protein